MSDVLQERAAALLADVEDKDGDSKYSRLTAEDRALVFELNSRGMSKQEIAKIVGCHPSSISRLLKYPDTRPGARMMLEAGAAQLAEKVLKSKNPDVARKVLTQIDVLPKEGGFFADNGHTLVLGVTISLEQHRRELKEMGMDEKIRQARARLDAPVVVLPPGHDAA